MWQYNAKPRWCFTRQSSRPVFFDGLYASQFEMFRTIGLVTLVQLMNQCYYAQLLSGRQSLRFSPLTERSGLDFDLFDSKPCTICFSMAAIGLFPPQFGQLIRTHDLNQKGSSAVGSCLFSRSWTRGDETSMCCAYAAWRKIYNGPGSLLR